MSDTQKLAEMDGAELLDRFERCCRVDGRRPEYQESTIEYRAELLRRLAPASPLPAKEDRGLAWKQRDLDIKNLRFYAQMAEENDCQQGEGL